MRGELPFEPALRERVALLRDLPLGVVDEIIARRITLMPGGRTLVATMRANGAYACLVSGGFTVFTGPVAAKIGFDEHRSNRLTVAGEKLAGRVEEPILGREAKRATLVELRERLGLSSQDTLAVGDGANDLAMLAAAGLGVAFRAKPAVAEAGPRAHPARRPHGASLPARLRGQRVRRRRLRPERLRPVVGCDVSIVYAPIVQDRVAASGRKHLRHITKRGGRSRPFAFCFCPAVSPCRAKAPRSALPPGHWRPEGAPTCGRLS
jgi:phosphoserine phosphatase SerB